MKLKTELAVLASLVFALVVIVMTMVSVGVGSLFQPVQPQGQGVVKMSQPLVTQEDLPADNTPRSSERLFPSQREGWRGSGTGSGHAFGYGVIYTIERIDVGQPVHIKNAVCVSGEPGVEIWSPIQELLELPVGTKFRLKEAGKSFAESLEIIQHGS